MNIHEYQAKRILHSYGAPIANGVAIYSLDQAKYWMERLKGPTYVVKSQIHAGGRGKGHFKEESAGSGGGVRLAYSKEEAISHVEQMLGKTLVTKQTGPEGRQVRRLYIEEAADIARELYVSLLVDRAAGQVSFVISKEGGMDIETVAQETPDKIHTILISPSEGVTPEDVAKICEILGFTGKAKDDAKYLFPNLYRAFVSEDMSLLEINPLIVMKNGSLRLLDAKVSFDNNALYRHKDIKDMRDLDEEDPKEVEASNYDLAYVALDGNIGCMVNGAGLAMATLDLIKYYGGSPANFLDVGGGATKEKVTAAFKIITADKNVKAILVNIFGGIMRCDIIAQGIIEAVREVGLTIPMVARLEGTHEAEGKKIIADAGLNVIAAENLADAAEKIVAAVQGA